MARVLQFALSNPVAGLESQFNEWYGGPHLQHGLLTPGILAGQRFRRQNGPWPAGKHDYLMIWEMDDPAFTLAELAKVKGSDHMPISPAIDMAGVQPPTMWRRAKVWNGSRPTTPSESRGPVVLALYKAAAGQDQDLQQSLLQGGLAQLADLPEVVSAEYLTLADEQIRGNARKYPHGLLIELQATNSSLAALDGQITPVPYADKDHWFAALFAPLAERLTHPQAAHEATP